jgi:group I intron endonuclease
MGLIIYKITSPSGKVYIGQTVNFIKRRSRYKKLNCKQQPKLYASLIKYGWENHQLEIIHWLPKDAGVDVLNEYEVFYIKAYKDAGIELMNLNDGGRNCIPTQETRLKMSRLKKGVPLEVRIGKDAADRQKKRMSEYFTNRPKSEAHKRKTSASNMGKKPKPESVMKKVLSRKANGIPAWNKGLKMPPLSEQHRNKISESMKLYKQKDIIQ